MTAPRFAPCRCGHSHAEHEALAPQCTADHCTCLRYQPATASAPNALAAVSPRPTAVDPSGPTAEQLLAAGKRSNAKRTVALADKIVALLRDLQGRLREDRAAAEARLVIERARAEARREVADLETKLAAAKAKLRGDRTPSAAKVAPIVAVAGAQSCPDCSKTFSTPQGRGSHRAKAHGYRRVS